MSPEGSSSGSSVRSRQISWTDPVAGAAEGLSRSGLEYLEGMRRGELSPSPVAALMDIRILDVAEGTVRFALTPQEFHYNPFGTVHGGVVTTLLDSAMACAGLSTLERGRVCASSEVKVSFLRPIRVETGDVTATGRVLGGGGRSLLCEGALHDRDGQLLAHATSTCVVLSPGHHS